MIGQPTEYHLGGTPHEQAHRESSIWVFSERVAGTIFRPSSTLREISERRAVVQAIMLVILIAGLSTSGQIANILGRIAGSLWSGASMFEGPAGVILAAEMSGVLWNLIWVPALWLITAGILYGIGYLLGGRGSFMGFWAASGFALIPQLLVAPLSPGIEAAAAIGPGWQLIVLLAYIPISIAAFVWTLVLLALALRQSMALSGGRSMAAVLILVGGMILLIAMLILMFILGIVAIVIALT